MASYQEVLEMSTYKPELRSEAIGWTLNSGLHAAKAMVQRGSRCEVGMIGAPMQGYAYPTPLHALGAQYKLLAPPTPYEEVIDPTEEYAKERGLIPGKQSVTFWSWYFVRDVEGC
jgi:hypothetical protein